MGKTLAVVVLAEVTGCSHAVYQGASTPTLTWPVNGIVTSGFGPRGQQFHHGIDIHAPAGTPVHAAEAGDVIYSDVLRGYGNVVIVRHDQHFATLYAHNQTNRVREGQRVRCGEVIGTLGNSGRTTGANLHFEVRLNDTARNPLYFLPSLEHVSARRSVSAGGG